MFRSCLTFALSLGLGSSAFAAKLTTNDAWIRQPKGNLKMTGAFLEIKNPATSDDKLLSASCSCAEVTELHQTSSKDGAMKMRKVAAIGVKAGETIELKPGSFHIMLMKLTSPLKDGQTVPLTLNFERAGAVTVQAKVK